MEICLKKALKWHLFRLLTQKIFAGGASAPPCTPPAVGRGFAPPAATLDVGEKK